MKIEISSRLVCPLGLLCQASEFISRNGLRKCAYPFDWTFTDLSVIENCLETNFEVFLNKSLYTNPKTKFHDRQCGHSVYHPDFFFHKNPMAQEEDHQYYLRCIERFNTLLNNKDSKLFVITIVPHGTIHPQRIYDLFQQEDPIIALRNELLEFTKILSKFTTNFNLFVVINESASNLVTSHNLLQEENLQIVTIKTKNDSNGVRFLNGEDNLYIDEVFNSIYKFN